MNEMERGGESRAVPDIPAWLVEAYEIVPESLWD
jgi:hypothetical protein